MDEGDAADLMNLIRSELGFSKGYAIPAKGDLGQTLLPDGERPAAAE